MDKYESLLKAALKASSDQGLPDVLLVRVKHICSEKKCDSPSVSMLTDMLANYEQYSDAGCGSETYSTKDIENVLKRIAQS